ncbi:MAG TPA: hypothetical protein PKM25_13295 [Candidatus Ozemobacteraceae bacterium]|nr:hypothetical protein [Candidatus Ozemobacteraceae bacterium]
MGRAGDLRGGLRQALADDLVEQEFGITVHVERPLAGAFLAKFAAAATSTIALGASLKGQKDRIPEMLKAALPGIAFSAEELSAIAAASDAADFETQLGSLVFGKFGLTFHSKQFEDLLNETHGHTGEDLFIHAMGAHQGLFSGVLRSWDIPRRIGVALGIRFP